MPRYKVRIRVTDPLWIALRPEIDVTLEAADVVIAGTNALALLGNVVDLEIGEVELLEESPE